MIALLGASTSVFAGEDMKSDKMMKSEMKMMDKSGDGMISKDEYMNHHEMMFEKMKKNKDGMVDMKDMSMMMHKEKEKAMMKDGMHK